MQRKHEPSQKSQKFVEKPSKDRLMILCVMIEHLILGLEVFSLFAEQIYFIAPQDFGII